MISPSESAKSGSILEVREVCVNFEGLRALQSVSLVLNQGEILGLIGPNGAGKTTLVNVVTGFQKLLSGRTYLDGQDITATKPYQRCRLGIARTFQGARLFKDLSVAENIELGGLGVRLGRKAARERALDLMRRFELDDTALIFAGHLPHGQERRVAIVRALSGSPRFLLLDEPAAGLNEWESDELVAVIAGIRDEFGCGILVIEHDMRLIMQLCDRIHVLDYGKTLAVGTPSAVRCDPGVIAAYLGDLEVPSVACR